MTQSYSSALQHCMEWGFSARCVRLPKMVLLLAFVSVVVTRGPRHFCQANPVYSCNICRNPPQGNRFLANGAITFSQSNGVTMSCMDLQLSVQDVNPTPSGAPGEARLCATAQYLAYLHCPCSGPAIAAPTDGYKDPNPACDLCGAPGLDFAYVPGPNQDKITDTRVAGRQSCSGLYLAAAKGVLTANLCPTIRQYSGPDCCNLAAVQPRQSPPLPTPPPAPAPVPLPAPSPQPASCLDPFLQCNTALSTLPCCPGFECRARVIGEPPICSAVSRQPRDRIHDEDVGGSVNRPRVRGSA
jgi:hypothetical protein